MLSLRLGFIAFGMLVASGVAGILPPGSAVQGRSIGDWTTAWWNWALLEHETTNPILDATGEHANRNQSGSVFFLAGAMNESVSREIFDVPSDKHILVPLINIVVADLVPQADSTRDEARSFVDTVDSLHFSLDGINVSEAELFDHREESSDFFTFALHPSFLGVEVFADAAWADGYWLMVEPLSPGAHVIQFGGSASSGEFSDVTATLQVILFTELGDFDGNGFLDAADIDALNAEVRNGTDLSVFDVNADTKVNREDRDLWVEFLRRTYFGDSNLDGEFNSTDLVGVFQANEFEDGIVGNSTWATGDWNGDSEFESSDFVLAFQAGGYEQGPRPTVWSVPELDSMFLVIVAVASVLHRWRLLDVCRDFSSSARER